MKKAIFIIILILIPCLTAIAQTNENTCQKIKIRAPEMVQPDEIFSVSASFENEKQPSTSKFNWTIIKKTEITKENNKGIVEIVSPNLRETTLKDNEPIIVLAENLDGNCQNAEAVKIFVSPTCILPYTIDMYTRLIWSEEKARLNNVIQQMQGLKDSELAVFVKFEKKSSHIERKNYLMKVFNYLSKVRQLDKSGITFLISESENRFIKFQSLSKDFTPDFCDNCLLIRGEDLEKIESLFQTTSIKKNVTNKKL